MALDASILAIATIFTLITVAYVAVLWSMRRNFFILLRSPLLTCLFGLFIVVRVDAKAYEYVVVWRGDRIGKYGTAALLGYPTLLTALVALVMTAVRLLVMYDPRKRAVWGRYVKENVLVRALMWAWLLMEVGVWSVASWMGIARTASMVAMIFRPLSFAATLLAAAWLLFRLKNVHDSTNLSRDIGLVGKALVGILALFSVLQVVPMTPVVYKYAQIVFLSRIPNNDDGGSERMSTSQRIGSSRRISTSQRRAACVDENRLAAIMSFPTLRAAFGEFCRKALCSESFEFLVDVAEFKAFDRRADEGIGDEISLDFARFLGIVNTYIKHDSHSEINIGSEIKRDIMNYVKFEAYFKLGPAGRTKVFDDAEVEIRNLLADNLLSKFLASAQYTEVVDLEIE
eukprot:g8699.t1